MTPSTHSSERDQRPSSRVPLIAALGSATLLAASLLAVYSLSIEPYRLELTHPSIPLDSLPPGLDGVSVLLLADPHVAHWGRREAQFTSMLKTIKRPDLIVWAGDFIQGKVGILHALRLCREVAQRFPDVPTYAIMGNAEHKMRLEFRLRFIGQLRDLGIRVLVNEWEPLTLCGETITVAGVDDPYYGHSDLAAALEGAPIGRQFTLLLAHSPQIATQAARAGVDLMLSGHTHGGQVRLPFVGPLKTQNPLARNFDCGLFDPERVRRILGREQGGKLVTYVSRGIGVANVPRISWLAPRFLCRPEIARLVLRLGRGE